MASIKLQNFLECLAQTVNKLNVGTYYLFQAVCFVSGFESNEKCNNFYELSFNFTSLLSTYVACVVPELELIKFYLGTSVGRLDSNLGRYINYVVKLADNANINTHWQKKKH